MGSASIWGVWSNALGERQDPGPHPLLSAIKSVRSNCSGSRVKNIVVWRADHGDDVLEYLRDVESCSQHLFLVVSLQRALWPKAPSNLRVLPTAWIEEFDLPGENFMPKETVVWTKRRAQCVWRGQTSGVYSKHNNTGPRKFIVDALKEHPLADVKFSGPHLKSVSASGPMMSMRQQMRYQCIIAIDGWGYPGSLRWVLSSGSIPLIASKYHVGIMKHLRPYVHYLPLSLNGSDAARMVEFALSHKNRISMELMLTQLRRAVHEHITTENFRSTLMHQICD